MALARKSRATDEVDDFFDTLVKGVGFPHPDNIHEAMCNAIIDQMNAYRKGIDGDDIDAELMEPELRTAIINMVYGGRDPHNTPYRHIRHALDNPLSIRLLRTKDGWKPETAIVDTPIATREKINGPLKAIRGRCQSCMGGSLDLVRACPSINCFLWPFRMGGNPFYGRLKGSDGGENEDGFEGAEEMAAADAEFERAQQERMERAGNPNANS